jgi:hypothetical protein
MKSNATVSTSFSRPDRIPDSCSALAASEKHFQGPHGEGGDLCSSPLFLPVVVPKPPSRLDLSNSCDDEVLPQRMEVITKGVRSLESHREEKVIVFKTNHYDLDSFPRASSLFPTSFASAMITPLSQQLRRPLQNIPHLDHDGMCQTAWSISSSRCPSKASAASFCQATDLLVDPTALAGKVLRPQQESHPHISAVMVSSEVEVDAVSKSSSCRARTI